jgi:hypothetical protein
VLHPAIRPAASALARRRTAPVLTTALVVVLAALLLGVLVPTPSAKAIGYSPLVDAPSSYDPQTTCTRKPKPGTVALARWLIRTYRVTRSMGMMRACHTGGRSEHKDGRAFDWGADVGKKRQKRAAYRFIRRALATDARGNANALARRMGIMYLIYNDTIWSSYRGFAPRRYLNAACKTRKKCSRTLRHRDHVHISLGFAGAAAQTSWYRSRNVPSQPVLHPGTRDLDADATAVTALKVPATGGAVSSPFYLRAGITYRVVATGTVRHGPAPAVGDATCVRSADSSFALTARGVTVQPPSDDWDDWSWKSREGSDHPASAYALPTTETRGVLVNGALRWEGECRADHTYEAWFTPTTRQRLRLQYADPAPGDNAGSVTVYVARDDITSSSLAR